MNASMFAESRRLGGCEDRGRRPGGGGVHDAFAHPRLCAARAAPVAHARDRSLRDMGVLRRDGHEEAAQPGGVRLLCDCGGRQGPDRAWTHGGVRRAILPSLRRLPADGRRCFGPWRFCIGSARSNSVGAVGVLATAFPIAAIVVGHLVVGVGAAIGVGALLAATDGSAPSDLGFVTLVERIFGLWAYVAGMAALARLCFRSARGRDFAMRNTRCDEA